MKGFGRAVWVFFGVSALLNNNHIQLHTNSQHRAGSSASHSLLNLTPSSYCVLQSCFSETLGLRSDIAGGGLQAGQRRARTKKCAPEPEQRFSHGAVYEPLRGLDLHVQSGHGPGQHHFGDVLLCECDPRMLSSFSLIALPPEVSHIRWWLSCLSSSPQLVWPEALRHDIPSSPVGSQLHVNPRNPDPWRQCTCQGGVPEKPDMMRGFAQPPPPPQIITALRGGGFRTVYGTNPPFFQNSAHGDKSFDL